MSNMAFVTNDEEVLLGLTALNFFYNCLLLVDIQDLVMIFKC